MAADAIGKDRIRVLVVGESPVARAGLEAALADSDQFDVVGACSHADAPRLMESTGADAVLMESRAFGPGVRMAPQVDAALTPRETEVLRLMADGASNKLIAQKLGISDHTAKFHVTSILSKLSAGTRTEAVTLGVRMGLVYL